MTVRYIFNFLHLYNKFRLSMVLTRVYKLDIQKQTGKGPTLVELAY